MTTTEKAIKKISDACKLLEWNISIKDDGNEVEGLIIGTDQFIDTYVSTKVFIEEVFKEDRRGEYGHQAWLRKKLDEFIRDRGK